MVSNIIIINSNVFFNNIIYIFKKGKRYLFYLIFYFLFYLIFYLFKIATYTLTYFLT